MGLRPRHASGRVARQPGGVRVDVHAHLFPAAYLDLLDELRLRLAAIQRLDRHHDWYLPEDAPSAGQLMRAIAYDTANPLPG